MKHLKFSLPLYIIASLLPMTGFTTAFSLYNESNGYAIGNYAAGLAALYPDASTGWTNPAGLAFLHHDQVVISGIGVFPFVSLNGQTQYVTQLPIPPESPPFLYNQSFENLSSGENALVPAFHYVHPLGPNTSFALSVVVPFGLSTDWPFTSPVRYEATLTKLSVIDISPEIGGQLTDHLTAGLGLDLETANVTFNQILGAPALLTAIDNTLATALDSQSINKGHSFGIGFHAGLLAHFNQNKSRIGLNIQSSVHHQFRGTSQLVGRLADPTLNVFDDTSIMAANTNASFISNQLYSNPITLPSITTLSLYHELNRKVTLLGSMVFTNWNCLQAIALYNVAAVSVSDDPADLGQATPATTSASTLENYRNTWRFALGTDLHLSEKFMLRMGGGFEETPTVRAERDVRLPEGNRIAIAIGGHYQLNKMISFDGGYSHYFIVQLVVNKTNILEINQFTVQARGKAHVDLFGGQIVLTLD